MSEAEWLLGDQQQRAVEQARHDSPGAVAARAKSQREFERLGAAAAARLAATTFPGLVELADRGAATILNGAQIGRFLGAHVASAKFADGQKGVIESAAPLATERRGKTVAINLALQPDHGGFHAAAPAVDVSIPDRLASGVSLPDLHLLLTPVDQKGTPETGTPGRLDGAAVIYADAATDTDALIEPTVVGFAVDALLRSVQSPRVLSYMLGLPRGARAKQLGSGAVDILEDGTPVAVVRPPTAVDAAGDRVPVTTRLLGRQLVIKVDGASNAYQFPIAVDPEVEATDSQLVERAGSRSNWEFHASSGRWEGKQNQSEEALVTQGASHATNEYAYWGYQTQGVSHIWEFSSESSAQNKAAGIESFLELESAGHPDEEKKLLSDEAEHTEEYGRRADPVICPKNVCAPSSGNSGNVIRFQQSATNIQEGKGFQDTLWKGVIAIAEPAGTHSTTRFNTTTPTFEVEVENNGKKETVPRANALYAAKAGWLSEFEGALELIAEDKGIGVSATRLEYESAPGSWERLMEHNYYAVEHKCKGIQCFDPTHTEMWTLNPKLPNGEDKIRYRAEETAASSQSTETEGVATVKVDKAKPRRLYVAGLPYGNELSERPYAIIASATDGEGTSTPSSGVKSLELYVDGKLVEDKEAEKREAREQKEGECATPRGECTATAEYTINGAQLGAGHHAIVLVAKDNAGNEERHPEQITIRHSTPVALGPGAVDLQSGDFSTSVTDVSLGGGLTVSRNYSSRAPIQGDEGALGPEWAMSVGASESLEELVDGSILLTDSTGQQTIFAKTESSTYESPPGDANLKLTVEENSETHVKSAFYLENVAAHTKDKFTLPPGGTKEWVPTVQEGAVATDTVSYRYRTAEGQTEYPYSNSSARFAPLITAGSDGTIWYVAAGEPSKEHFPGPPYTLGHMTPTGAVLGEYELPEPPEGLTTGPEGNIWVTLSRSNIVDKVTPNGTVTQYHPVTNCTGTCTVSLRAIVAGSEGDLWISASASNKSSAVVVKLSPSGVTLGEYAVGLNDSAQALAVGPEGDVWTTLKSGALEKFTQAGQGTVYNLNTMNFEDIAAGAEGDLWVTAPGSGKVLKVSNAGTVLGEYTVSGGGKGGVGPYFITRGPDNNMWFTDQVNGSVSKITPQGVITEYHLPSESWPWEITASPDGRVWFGAHHNIDAMPVSGTITEPTEVVAPVPPNVECLAGKLEPGCRVLKFVYSEGTTATGEAESEWGEYKGRLKEVLYETYNPATKKVEEPGVAVAGYRYDRRGELRVEWDPRITPALKTRYGYDDVGDLTALDPPGQEPWTLTYGTAAGDSGLGRLVKIARAAASTELWHGESVKNSEPPKISGTPEVGVRLAVAQGKWSGRPVSYGYQWERCPSGEPCTRIVGATNPNYTPTSADVGDALTATVTATNGGGSEASASSPTVAVAATETTQAVDPGNSIRAVSCIAGTVECIVSEAKGNTYYATNVSSEAPATWKLWFGPTGKSPSQSVFCLSTALCLLADGKEAGGGSLYYATSMGSSWTEAASPTHGVDALGCAAGTQTICVAGQDAGGAYSYATSPSSSKWTSEAQGSAAIKGVTCLLTSFCVMVDSEGRIHVATSTSQVESSAWKESDVDGASTLNGVACTATSSCVAVDGEGDALKITVEASGAATAVKHDIDGNTSLTGVACSGEATCVAVDAVGHVFVSTNAGESWSERTQLQGELTSVSCASVSLCVTVDTKGDTTAFDPAVVAPEGEARGEEPGTTIEYAVPVTGAHAPYGMGEAEVAKWGQTDVPVEATAIIPPDEVQGWPAASYRRATVYYLDEQGRQVNVAAPSTAPSGSIATTEYNEYNDVVRVLSADDRATALAAGENSAEVSRLLDTEKRYNEPECQNEQPGQVAEPGTRLCETLGPQHEIKYVSGKEQQEALGRNHEEFFYDQGVPKEKPFSEETYNLVTETSDLALLANREDREVRTVKTSYSGQNNLGWRLREPTSTTIDPRSKEANPRGLNITRTTIYNEVTGQVEETRGAAAEHTLTYNKTVSGKGTEPGKLKSPWGIAVDAKGDVWVSDLGNNRIEEFSAEGTYLSSFGELGSGNGQLKSPGGIAFDAKGDLWVADTGNNRIEEFNPTEGKWMSTIGSFGIAKGKLREPVAIAFDGSGNLWVADTGNNRVQKFNVTKDEATSEFGSLGNEPGELDEPKGIAVDAEGNIWVSDKVNNRLQEFSSSGTLLAHFGTEGSGEGQFSSPLGVTMDGSGNVWVADRLNNRMEAFSTSTDGYVSQAGWKGSGNGQLLEPRTAAFDAHGNMWVVDSLNNRIEEFSPGGNAHDGKVVYYGAEPNESYPSCGGHAEWAGLICKSLPAKQPELNGLPRLPETTSVYNMWLEPERVEETFGSAVRVKKEEYDAAGRLTHSETSASGDSDKTLPAVSIAYNAETGTTEKQTTSLEGKEHTILDEDNRLGQLVKYSDGDGNTASYRYAGPENDFLLEEVADGHVEDKEGKEAKSYQRYSYDGTTKVLDKLEDSAAGVFTASYDAEGLMTSETYPNGMSACYSNNAVGEQTGVEYISSANCSEKEPTVLFADTRLTSIHGAMLSQESTLAKETYTYDSAERLTEVQETPVGEGCTTRAYAYDEEGNRTSLTTRKAGSKGECATEGGATEGHNYDEASRLTDGGITYEAFGNVTTLPAGDAEGHEVTSTFYVDGAVASQTQNGVKEEYRLDPEGRIAETVVGGKTVVNHYDAAGEAVAWTSEEEGKKTSRLIPGIDGTLSAVQTGNEVPELEVHDLQGNIVGTVSDRSGETTLKATYNSTEFGAPNAGKTPPKYSWLGASGVANSFTSGMITYGSTSYVPQTGRSLQSEEVKPPGLPNGSGGGAPVDFEEEPWVMLGAGREAAEAPGLEAGREREAAEAACRANPEACSEDPSWSGDVSIPVAEAVSGALQGIEIANELSGKLAEKALEVLAEDLHINFLSQLKDIIQKGLFGYSYDQVSAWAFSIGQLLDTCVELATDGAERPRDPHCWLYIPTTVRYAYKGGPKVGEIPNFAVTATVGYCPWGEYSKCFEVNKL